MKSLITGEFASLPSSRLYGAAGEVQEATAREKMLRQHRVKSARFTKDHKMLWVSMRVEREIEFSPMEVLWLGELPRDAWQARGV